MSYLITNLGFCKLNCNFIFMQKASISICQRCQSTFQCKANDIANCQCATVTISKEAKQYLKTTNYGCLCKNCLMEINQQIKNALTTQEEGRR